MFGTSLLAAIFVAMSSSWGLRRRGGTENQSVQEYRHTLETLQDIRTRSSSGTVRVIPSGGTEERPPPRPLEPPTPGGRADRGDTQLPGPQTARVPNHRDQRAMSAMNHRPRHLLAPVVAVVLVLVVVLALAAVGAHSRPKTPPRHGATSTTVSHHPRTTHPRTTHPRTTHPRTTHPSSTPGTDTTRTTTPSRSHSRSHSASSSKSKAATTTTAPRSYQPSATTAGSATYVPLQARYRVVVTATTARCWVEITSASGTTVFAAALSPGQRHALTTTGAISISLGAPASITATLDGRPVVIPTALTAPFVLAFNPSVPTTTTTTTTGPSVTTTSVGHPTTTASTLAKSPG